MLLLYSLFIRILRYFEFKLILFILGNPTPGLNPVEKPLFFVDLYRELLVAQYFDRLFVDL